MAGNLPSLVRFSLAVLAGTVGWMVGFMVAFVPAQAILTNPALQSAKMIAVFFTLSPLPRASSPAQMLLLVAVVVTFLVLGYRLSRPDPSHPWWQRGLRFGTLAWLLMVPWFELYLPWNVLHEPLPLVALEAGCWWITLTCSGLAISLAHGSRNEQRYNKMPPLSS
jgi:hypothetical protein